MSDHCHSDGARGADDSISGDLPADPAFYRRVLDESPSPTMVVDENAIIVYANAALARLGGWTIEEQLGKQVFDFMPPDAIEPVAEAFFALASDVDSAEFGDDPWASIQSEMLAVNGQVIPVIVTGVGGLAEPSVNGIIYEVRPALEQDILRRGLTGLTQGEPIDSILSLIVDMIALPPHGLDAAILEPLDDGSHRVVVSTSATLSEILTNAVDPQPWALADLEPMRIEVRHYPGATGEELFAAGYREFWAVAPEPKEQVNGYRIVAACAEVHDPYVAQVDRMVRANELAGVVLMRARADAMLEHSATHDPLTQLPNREGLRRQAQRVLKSAKSAALLFIDLDDFKKVNDARGHPTGDRVLEVAAERLINITRNDDVVARLGGDEFVVLIGTNDSRRTNRDRVEIIAERALAELSREIEIGETVVQVAASVGAAIGPGQSTLDDLMIKADAAMYEAKRADGNRHHIVEF